MELPKATSMTLRLSIALYSKFILKYSKFILKKILYSLSFRTHTLSSKLLSTYSIIQLWACGAASPWFHSSSRKQGLTFQCPFGKFCCRQRKTRQLPDDRMFPRASSPNFYQHPLTCGPQQILCERSNGFSSARLLRSRRAQIFSPLRCTRQEAVAGEGGGDEAVALVPVLCRPRRWPCRAPARSSSAS
jgi:hypothetical protein